MFEDDDDFIEDEPEADTSHNGFAVPDESEDYDDVFDDDFEETSLEEDQDESFN